MLTQLDHIVITAPSLSSGETFIHEVLGVYPQFGGRHHKMGTHNSLLKLGNTEYLEVIAKNPAAPPINHSRWFNLDRSDLTDSVKLAAWVARTNDIETITKLSPISLGKIEHMSRDHMHWLITTPSDGTLPLNGISPYLIQWLDHIHPATKLPDSGCSLLRLEGFHPEAEKISEFLDAIGFTGKFNVVRLPPKQKPFLIAHIQTPKGIKRLSSNRENLSV